MTEDKQKLHNQEKFAELIPTFEMVIAEIDAAIGSRKAKVVSGELKTIDQGFPNKKEFLMTVEQTAVDEVAKKVSKTPSWVRERWRLTTLPEPFYQRMEEGVLPMSKVKLAKTISFDPDDPKSIECAETIAKFMETTSDTEQIKAFVLQQAKAHWTPSTAVVGMLLKQHNATAGGTGNPQAIAAK